MQKNKTEGAEEARENSNREKEKEIRQIRIRSELD